MRFREREKELDRKDLIFPFRYIDVSDIEPDECHTPEVLTLLKSRQWIDFEHLRYRDPRTEEVATLLGALARSIRTALRLSVVPNEALAGVDGDREASTRRALTVDRASPTRAGSSSPGTPLPLAAPIVPASPPKPAWASATGSDTFGTWADIAVPAARGPAVVQRLRLIPAGRFKMGSPDNEPGRYADEGPVHDVTVAEPFWLFDTPCTQALWEAVMGGNPSYFKSPTRPVERVSGQEAQHFLAEVNGRIPGLDLTLPSEARWEYACRAGTDTATYAGPIRILGKHNAPVLNKIAWYGGNSGQDFALDNGVDSSGWAEKQYPHRKAGTHPVKGKDPNARGLYDMLGNVWEWCEDVWHDNYQDVPSDGDAWLGGGAAGRVVRGGSWDDEARLARAACRLQLDPADRGNDVGFRCARGHFQ
ncbi:MAG: formylglycine-generating enzyme family protein [Acetobacteraceae bacterium]|nr:formylglycine-generating enzyme family protein [Acetobacteraceae bacterium]